jgi:hypothetical protein
LAAVIPAKEVRFRATVAQNQCGQPEEACLV